MLGDLESELLALALETTMISILNRAGAEAP
jgi:hypothetical protein